MAQRRPFGFGMQSANDCFESNLPYDVCAAVYTNTANEHWGVPITYADEKDINPYVVGGAAWRALHPEAAAQLDRAQVAVAAPQAATQGTAPAPSAVAHGSSAVGASASAGVPSWLIVVGVFGLAWALSS